jgi:hypothetical protein
MTICRRFLPKRVNLRCPAFLHHLRKARRFHFQKLHVGRDTDRRTVRSLGFRRARRSRPKKSARELRQGGSDYRCCIPALAGFVSPPSIAPDGEEKFAQDRHRAIGFLKSKIRRALTGARFWLHRPREIVNRLALIVRSPRRTRCHR